MSLPATMAPTVDANAGYGRRKAILVLMVLLAASLALNLSRSPLYLFADSVRKSLAISDVQLSLLFGAFVAAPELIMSLVGGWLADRAPRRMLLCGAIVLWTAGAIVCGLAANYGWMAGGRVLIALGAGIRLPLAMTWLYDAFPADKRGRAIGVLFVVLSIGSGVATTIVGFVHHLAVKTEFGGWPLLGRLAPWRETFLLLAVPGLFLLPLATRAHDARSAHASANAAPSRGSVAAMSARWGFVTLVLGIALTSMLDTGNLDWMATVLERSFGYDVQRAGFVVGIVIMTSGALGPLIGGWLGDRAFRRFGAAGRLWLCAGTAAAGAPLLLAYLSSNPLVLSVALALTGVVTVTVMTQGYVSLQGIVPSTQRGLGTGVTGACTTLMATSSPTLIALLSGHLFSGRSSLAHALALIGPILALAAAGSLALTAQWCMRRQKRPDEAI